MKLILLVLLFCSPLFAERIGPVEYELPNDEWVIKKHFDCHNGITLIYTLRSQEPFDATSYFAASFNQFPMEIDTFEQSLIKIFPGMQICVNTLQEEANSALFEWSVSEINEEKLHVWTRLFSTPEGSVILSYQTENTAELDHDRNLWLPLLEGASIIRQ